MTKLKRVHYKANARAVGAFILLSRLLVAVFAAAVLLVLPAHLLAQQPAQASAQTQLVDEASARDIRGASPYVAIENESAPKLLVDPPIPEGLPLGIFWAQYRVENLHIVPVPNTGTMCKFSTCRASAHHR